MSTTQAESVLDRVPRGLLVGGWRDAEGGRSLAVEDPGTGETLCEVADGSVGDALEALAVAAGEQARWWAVPAGERSAILRRAHRLVEERRDDLAAVITLEMGKPLAEALAEVDYAADYLDWFAGEAVRISGRIGEMDHRGTPGRVLREAVGPCVLVTPWNFPLAMAARKVAPAVAAGCTMVLKPARQTPLAALALARVLEEAGLPAGVLGVIVSSESGAVVEALLTEPRSRKLSFTGSTEVGRLLLAQASENLLRTSMELGGNAPFVVFDDADVPAAVEAALVAKLRNGGQACTAANRFLVHESVAEPFAVALAARFATIEIGHGLDPATRLGPLIDARRCQEVSELVDEAAGVGAVVLTGGKPLDAPGSFYPPTVLADVRVGARIADEEIFGPVAPVMSFSDEDEAVALANATTYGLAAYVCTADAARADRVARRLEAGMVAINRGTISSALAPFGGIKHSGFGREGGPEGIEEYLQTKYVAG